MCKVEALSVENKETYEIGVYPERDIPWVGEDVEAWFKRTNTGQRGVARELVTCDAVNALINKGKIKWASKCEWTEAFSVLDRKAADLVICSNESTDVYVQVKSSFNGRLFYALVGASRKKHIHPCVVVNPWQSFKNVKRNILRELEKWKQEEDIYQYYL